MKHTQCFKGKDYPRPQFTRDSFINLNGEWDFVFDYENKLIDHNQFLTTSFDKKIIVPYVYNVKASGINEQKFCPVVWYKKKFFISVVSKCSLLNFEGVDHDAKVYVNKQFVGEHHGGYSRFTFNISNYLVKGENEIIVRVEDTMSTNIPRGKQRWLDHNYSCFYEETTGIWKTVWIEQVSKTHLINVEQLVNLEKCEANFTYHIENFTSDLFFKVEVSFDGELVSLNETKVLEKDGEISCSFKTDNKGYPYRTWSPGNPQLFDIKYYLVKGNKVIDEVGSYCGLVQYDAINNVLRVNNYPSIYLKMVLDQGYFADKGLSGDYDDFAKDIEFMKGIGVNGVRKHEKIEDERFHYLADVYGLICWVEMPSGYSYSSEYQNNLIKEWPTIVHQYKNFPSTMTFVLFNESWGINMVSTDKNVQLFVEAAYKMTKSLAPNKMVISNDGWEHTLSDLITFHTYLPGKKEIHEIFKDMDQYNLNQKTGTADCRMPFAKGYSYQNQPIIFTEIAGVAYIPNPKEKGWGYGQTMKSKESFLKRLKDICEAIRELPNVSGYCVTQIADVRQEKNGLMDERHNPKATIEELKEALA